MSQYVEVNMAYEQFLKALFGASDYHGYVGEVSFGTWRKDLVKVIRNLRRAVELTVHADAQHLDALLSRCDSAQQEVEASANSQEAANAAIRNLAMIAFMLVGEFPDHYHEKRPSHFSHWILCSERQIGYTQSLQQKASLIRRLARQGALGPRLSGDDCDRKYHELAGNAREFLQWMKDRHPRAYLRCL